MGEFLDSPGTALVQGSDGNFYGTTDQGGAYGYGTIFKITPSGTLTTLYSLDSADGQNPNGLIQAANGTFYGTTAGNLDLLRCPDYYPANAVAQFSAYRRSLSRPCRRLTPEAS
jgi:uncharacterized repeat protein (TIGR03803 family)